MAWTALPPGPAPPYSAVMGWFGTGKKRGRVPAWASAMPDRATFDAWVEETLEILEVLGVSAHASADQLASGTLVLREGEVAFNTIVDECAAEPNPKRWRRIIKRGLIDAGALPRRKTDNGQRHGRNMRDGVGEPSRHTFSNGSVEVDLARGPLEAVAGLLKVQLFSRHSRGGFELVDRDTIVCREIADGLSAALVFDFGTHETTVPRSDTRSWGASPDKIWKTGLDNVLSGDVNVRRIDDELTLVIGNGPFVSALALRLEDFVEEALEQAPAAVCHVVSIPNWHTLVIQRFDRPPKEHDLSELAELTASLFDYEDPLSPDLFRCEDGNMTRFAEHS